MGTRGLIGWYVAGQGKATYSHVGAYPDGNGLTMLQHLRSIDEKRAWADYRRAVKALEVVNSEDRPTPEHLQRTGKYADLSVGMHTDATEAQTYYQLLRGTQGDPDKILDSGLLIDNWSFGWDSLFNEGSVIAVLDGDGELQWYDGFITQPHTDGLWAAANPEPVPDQNSGPYYPVRLVARWPLSQLPTDEQFLADIAAATADKKG